MTMANKTCIGDRHRDRDDYLIAFELCEDQEAYERTNFVLDKLDNLCFAAVLK